MQTARLLFDVYKSIIVSKNIVCQLDNVKWSHVLLIGPSGSLALQVSQPNVNIEHAPNNDTRWGSQHGNPYICPVVVEIFSQENEDNQNTPLPFWHLLCYG